MIHHRKHPAKKEKVSRLDRLDVRSKRRRDSRKLDAKVPQSPLRTALRRSSIVYHRPVCAPSSTCSTSPGYVSGFRQINDGVGDILRVRDRSHRGAGLQRLMRGVTMQRRIDSPRRNRVEANLVSRILARKAQRNRVQSAFGHHWDRRRYPATGLSAKAAVMVITLPPLPCDNICLTASCVM